MPGELQTPLIVEQDGWTLASGSTNRQTEAELRAQLADKPIAPTPAETPVETPPAEPVVEAPAVEAAAADPAAAVAEVEAPPADPVKGGKKPNRVDLQRQRIDTLTAKTRTLDEEVARLRAENEQLKIKGPALPGTTPAAAAAPAVETPAPAAAIPPEPTWGGAEGYEAKGKSWEEFHVDHTKWVREEATRNATAAAERVTKEELAKFRTSDEEAKKEASAASARTAALSAHQTRVAAAREKHPDFDVVVEENLSDIQSPFIKHMIFYTGEGAELMYHLGRHREEAQILNDLEPTRPMVDGLRRAKNLIKVMSHLAQHPDEFKRLSELDPVSTLMEIGSLDKTVGGAPAGTSPTASISRARPPVRPVTGTPQQTPKPQPTAVAEMDFGPEYVREANRLDHQRRFGRGF